MSIAIDTPLLVVGRGPAALVVAKLVSGWGLASLIAGHEPIGGDTPVELGAEAVAILTPHGVLDVLRPYLASADPPAVAPLVFEEALKRHCVVDLNITVYDGMRLEEARREGRGVRGVLTDGRSRWTVAADAFVDADELPSALPEAVVAAAALAERIMAERS